MLTIKTTFVCTFNTRMAMSGQRLTSLAAVHLTRELSALTKDDLRPLFRRLDENKYGVLTIDELVLGASQFGLGR